MTFILDTPLSAGSLDNLSLRSFPYQLTRRGRLTGLWLVLDVLEVAVIVDFLWGPGP